MQSLFAPAGSGTPTGTSSVTNKFSRKSILFFMLIAVMSFSANTVFAQDALKVTSLVKDKDAAAWHSFKKIGEVEILYQYVDCGPLEFVQFKINNPTKSNMTVSWEFRKSNKGNTIGNAGVFPVSQNVNAMSSVSRDCAYKNDNLGFFVREGLNPLTVTDIEVVNIKATITQ